MSSSTCCRRVVAGYLPAQPGPCLLLHGGAWDIPDNEVAAHTDGLRQAAEHGKAQLEEGTSALSVVSEVVSISVGYGCYRWYYRS